MILQLNTLIVNIDGPVPVPFYIDFKASFETAPGKNDGSFAIATGADPVIIDYNTWMIRASVGFFEMRVASCIYLAGSMALDIGKHVSVTLTDGSSLDVMVMTIAASDVYGFFGINGPYWEDRTMIIRSIQMIPRTPAPSASRSRT